ncbi:hypothetical protein BDF14DRAFT_1881102 [Spinellus fusiger]|nr:hypothetical protein BDF14DRAFT_1881102 [Spinellus fusiger]
MFLPPTTAQTTAHTPATAYTPATRIQPGPAFEIRFCDNNVFDLTRHHKPVETQLLPNEYPMEDVLKGRLRYSKLGNQRLSRLSGGSHPFQSYQSLKGMPEIEVNQDNEHRANFTQESNGMLSMTRPLQDKSPFPFRTSEQNEAEDAKERRRIAEGEEAVRKAMERKARIENARQNAKKRRIVEEEEAQAFTVQQKQIEETQSTSVAERVKSTGGEKEKEEVYEEWVRGQNDTAKSAIKTYSPRPKSVFEPPNQKNGAEAPKQETVIEASKQESGMEALYPRSTLLSNESTDISRHRASVSSITTPVPAKLGHSKPRSNASSLVTPISPNKQKDRPSTTLTTSLECYTPPPSTELQFNDSPQKTSVSRFSTVALYVSPSDASPSSHPQQDMLDANHRHTAASSGCCIIS